MGVQRREVWVCIVLSIVTCGIYLLYWYYKILDDLYTLNGVESKAALDLIITLVTCGIYQIYINYKMSDMENNIRVSKNYAPKNNGILYLLLTIFGLSIIVMAIVQSNINDELSGIAPNRDDGFHN